MKIHFPFCLVLLLFATAAGAQVISVQGSTDTVHGRLIKTITTRGQFVSFDKNRPDRFFLRDASDQMEMKCVMTEPGTDLFFASHAKDDLKVTYQVRDVTITGGKTEWLNFAMKIRSLKTGDDAQGWQQKMASDTALLQSCQEQLRKLRSAE